MKLVSKRNSTHFLRFDQGEEVLTLLKKYCQENHIHAGYFSAIGACNSLELAWYNVETKEYTTKQYNEMMEIASVTGNVGMTHDGLVVHAHGVFSTTHVTVGAHIMNMTVGVTCEVILNTLPDDIKRQYNEDIGLNLLT